MESYYNIILTKIIRDAVTKTILPYLEQTVNVASQETINKFGNVVNSAVTTNITVLKVDFAKLKGLMTGNNFKNEIVTALAKSAEAEDRLIDLTSAMDDIKAASRKFEIGLTETAVQMCTMALSQKQDINYGNVNPNVILTTLTTDQLAKSISECLMQAVGIAHVDFAGITEFEKNILSQPINQFGFTKSLNTSVFGLVGCCLFIICCSSLLALGGKKKAVPQGQPMFFYPPPGSFPQTGGFLPYFSPLTYGLLFSIIMLVYLHKTF